MIFVDTSFWAALYGRRDPRLAEASTLFRAHARRLLVTSNNVLGETWTLLLRRAGRPNAVRFIDAIERTPRVAVQHVEEGLEAAAWMWLRRHDERDYSFVDATSFVFMRRHGIEEAFAFDEGFSAAGFVELRA